MFIVNVTAALCIALVSVIFSAQCWIANRHRPDPALRLLGLSTLAMTLSVPLAMLWPVLPSWASIAIGRSINLLGLSLAWHATASVFGRRLSPLLLIPAPLLWLLLCMAPGFLRSAEAMLLAVAGIGALLVALPLCALLRHERRTTSHRVLIVVGTVHLLCCLLTPALLIEPTLLSWRGIALVIMPFETLSYIVWWFGLSLALVAETALLAEHAHAMQDELSGVLNRRGFWRHAETMPERTLLLFDIDHFKRINDRFGHAAGDAAIVRFAEIAMSVLGKQAVFGRVGGEEFAAAFSRLDAASACRQAEAIRARFAQDGPPEARATVSIGISVPGAAGTAGQVLNEQMAAADRALYRAKRLGRNRVELAIGATGPPLQPAAGAQSGYRARSTRALSVPAEP